MIAEADPICSSASGFRSQIRNDNNVEFQAFRLMNGQNADRIVGFTGNLSLSFANVHVLSAIAKMTDGFVQSRNPFAREFAGNFNQLADIGDTLWAIGLRHHDDIEVRSAYDVLKNLGGSRTVS